MAITTTGLLVKVTELPELRLFRVDYTEKYKRIVKTLGAAVGTGSIGGYLISFLIGSFMSPVGVLIMGGGAITAGSIAYARSTTHVESIPDVILMKLTERQKCELAARIRTKCLQSIKVESAHDFDFLVARNPALSKVVADTVIEYIESQNMKIVRTSMTQV